MDNEWELSKENIQPRRQGRDINCLMTALTPFKDDNRKRLDDERGMHETRIRTYDGDDPLSVWSEYISWSEQHFPRDHKNAFILLEKCIEDILIDKKYKNDDRALSIWLKYNDMTEDPLPIFNFMFTKDICTSMAGFYIDWAVACENVGNMKKADEVLQLGINRGAQPISRLEHHVKNFETRLVRKVQEEGDIYNEDSGSSDMRTALSTLKKGKKGAVSYDRSKGKQYGKGLNMNSTHSNSQEAKFRIFTDQENAEPVPLPGGSLKWSKPPVQTKLKKENTEFSRPWNKQKIPVVTKTSLSGHFAIHVDEEIVTPQRQMPQRIFSERKPLSAKKLDKAGTSDKLLDTLSKGSQQGKCIMMCDTEKMFSGTEEFSCEEIRAALYLKREEELRQLLMDDNQTKIIEVEMNLSPDVTMALINGANVLPYSPPKLHEKVEVIVAGDDKENIRHGGSSRQQLFFEDKGKEVPQDVSTKAEFTPLDTNDELGANAYNDSKQTSTDNNTKESCIDKNQDRHTLAFESIPLAEVIPQDENKKLTSKTSAKLDEEDNFLSLRGFSIDKEGDVDFKLCNTRDLKRSIKENISPLRDCGEGKRLNLFSESDHMLEADKNNCLSTSIHTVEALQTVQEMFNQTICSEKTEQTTEFPVKPRDSFDDFELQFKATGGKQVASSVKKNKPFQIYTEDDIDDRESRRHPKSQLHGDPMDEDSLPLSLLGGKLKDIPNNDNWFIPIQNNKDTSHISNSGLASQLHLDCLKENESCTGTVNSIPPRNIPIVAPVVAEGHLIPKEDNRPSISKTSSSTDHKKNIIVPVPNSKPQFSIFEDEPPKCPKSSEKALQNGRIPFSVLRDPDEDPELEKGKQVNLPFSIFDDSFTNTGFGRSKDARPLPFAVHNDSAIDFNTSTLGKELSSCGRDARAESLKQSPVPRNGHMKPELERIQHQERLSYSIYEKTLPLEESIVMQAYSRADVSVTLDIGTTLLSDTKRVLSSTPFHSTLIDPPDVAESHPLQEKANSDFKVVESYRQPISSVSTNDSLTADDLRKEINNATSNPIDVPAAYQTTYTNFYTHQSDLSPIDEDSEGSRTIPRSTNDPSRSTIVSSTTIVDTSTIAEQKSRGGSFCVEQVKEKQSLDEQVHSNRPDAECADSAADDESPDCVVNPFEGDFVAHFVRHIAESLQDIVGFQKVLETLPRVHCKSRVQIADFEYYIIEEIGCGGFGKIYKVSLDQDHTIGTPRVLKIVKVTEICVLEHYTGYIIHSRIDELGIRKEMHNAFSSSSKAFIFDDGGCLEMRYYRGTLLDLVNAYKLQSRPISEAFALILTLELLKIMETLHECGIIHGDLKPDNVFCLELNQDSNPLTTNLLRLGDYGRAIDVSVLLPNTMFCGSCNTDSFECIQMRERRPWKYQVDYFSLANTLHVLIFGSYLNIYKEGNTGLWRKTSSFKRTWDQLLWTKLFDTLINHEGIERCTTIVELMELLWNRRGLCLETCDIREELRAFQQLKRISKKH